MRALDYLRSPSRIWAIEQGAWEEMVTICKGQNLTQETIEASIGKMNNKVTNQYEVIDGVAVVPVIGPIVRYGNLFSNISGATSVDKLTMQFNEALNDDSVESILFKIDSPGGEANGINEFAEQIYNARGIKPIQAYVSGQGCSAAYWIASAVDEGGLFLDETAMAGSIGVAAVVKDDTDKDAADGVKTYKFVSEGSENKRPDLETDEGKSVVMSSLNAMAQVFRGKVARNRSNDSSSLTVRDVIDKFNRGGILMGEAAVKAGLADGISSYQQVLTNLISKSGDGDEDTSLEITQENFMSKEDIQVEASVTPEAHEAAVQALQTKLTDAETAKTALAEQVAALQAQINGIETELAAASAAKVTLEKENLVHKANAEAAALEGKITPAQKEGFVKGYVLAATDDKNNPLEGESRLDNFLSMWKASEDHGLLEEELAPEGHQELAAAREEAGDGLAELLATATQFAQKENAKAKLHAGN
jgi:capsid assembly protease